MFATVFIPTGSRAKSLDRVLKSLVSQTYKDFEVIIVDYKSNDNTLEIINKYKSKLNLNLIHQKQKGLARAANMALKKAKGKVFIRTDDDVEMSKGWLEAIHETFIKDKQVGGVTGPTVIPDNYKKNRDLFVFIENAKNGNIFWKLIWIFYSRVLMDNTPFRVSHWLKSGAFSLGSNYKQALKEPVQTATNLECCNWSVLTSKLRKIGGFEEIYTGVGEHHEAEAALRVKNLGYKLVFNPKAYLKHLPSKDGFFADRPASYPRMINLILFYKRNLQGDRVFPSYKFLLYIIFQDCYYLYSFLKSGQTAQLGAIYASIKGLLTIRKN